MDFREYDVMVREREASFIQRCKQAITIGLRNNNDMRRAKMEAFQRGNLGIMTDIDMTTLETKVMDVDGMMEPIPRSSRDIPAISSVVKGMYDRLFQSDRKQNLHTLLQTASSEGFSPETRKQAYLRLLDEVNTIYQEREEVFNGLPIRNFLRDLSVPDLEIHVERFQAILKRLQQRRYISKKDADRFEKLLVPYQTSCLKSVVPSRFTPQVEQPQNQQPMQDDTSEVLDYLTDLFVLEKEVAARYAPRVTLDELCDLHDKLEARVGGDYARMIVALNPDVLLYQQQGKLATYLKVLKQVQQRVFDANAEDFLIHEGNVRQYASLDSLVELKNELYAATATPPGDQEPEEVRPAFNIAEYTFLHRGFPPVEGRLCNLIERGEVTVSDQEHWDGGTSGARGRHILQKIVFQMGSAFAAKGLPRPEYDLNFGTRTVTISDETREQLQNLRDEAYSLQR